ncbi:MAG: JAB domain-containing protein [Candidatus Latescibacteria bacterium]|nr:JAB domain-containing protein [Candidatus Latescibacterota bacterium]
MSRNNKSGISGLAKVDMPREKLSTRGPEALKDEELLAILLGTGYEGKNVLEVSKAILRKHPKEKLLDLTFETLTSIKGIGGAKASILMAGFELAKRALNRGIGILPTISKPADVLPLVVDLREKRKEHFVALLLNARNQVLHREDVSVGSLNASLVHPREVFAPAVERAAAVILVHNHPSGDVTPSRDDLDLTDRLVKAGQIMGIDVLDHLIVGKQAFLSFKERGLF